MISIDFHRLNEVTIKDKYPLPKVQDCFDSLSSKMYFASLDVSYSFLQIPLRESSRDYTAFSTRLGQFRYKRMPMGFCNSSSIFARCMQTITSGICFVSCLVYLDNILIFGKDYQEYLRNFELVLQRLRAAGLKLKPSKAKVLQKSIQFLGHVVSREGLSVCTDKIAVIQSWPYPKNLKELRGFLGLTGYYRQFIRGYSKLAAPLTDMLKKNKRVQHSPEAQVAFDAMKLALVSTPVLALPRDDDASMFVLDTDASDVAAGAVLSQIQDGIEHVIAYASRTFNKAERGYCVTRRELGAFIFGLKVFKPYLLGRKFKVRVDHSALTFLRTAKDPIGQDTDIWTLCLNISMISNTVRVIDMLMPTLCPEEVHVSPAKTASLANSAATSYVSVVMTSQRRRWCAKLQLL